MLALQSNKDVLPKITLSVLRFSMLVEIDKIIVSAKGTNFICKTQ